ncbi:hypothetical protein B0H11DRAFT_1177251 [Mycena galericulata]|nr:hypothetical protein B0H11DRAFT_1177251 [Mycena galericulata]
MGHQYPHIDGHHRCSNGRVDTTSGRVDCGTSRNKMRTPTRTACPWRRSRTRNLKTTTTFPSNLLFCVIEIFLCHLYFHSPFTAFSPLLAVSRRSVLPIAYTPPTFLLLSLCSFFSVSTAF